MRSSSEAVAASLTAGRGAAEAVTTGVVVAVVEDLVLALPGRSSVDLGTRSARDGSRVGCEGSADELGGTGAEGPRAADPGTADLGVSVIGCFGCWLVVTVGVSVNKLTAGSGEKIGLPVDPKSAERLKSAVARVRAVGRVE